jgi:hypothetical protein
MLTNAILTHWLPLLRIPNAEKNQGTVLPRMTAALPGQVPVPITTLNAYAMVLILAVLLTFIAGLRRTEVRWSKWIITCV